MHAIPTSGFHRIRWQTAVLHAVFVVALAGAAVLPCAAWANGPWRASAQNTEHWAQMNPQERLQYQQRMRGFSRLDECLAFEAAHRDTVAARASGRERTRGSERASASGCAQLRALGALQ